MKSESRLGDSAATMERTVDGGADTEPIDTEPIDTERTDIRSHHGRQYRAPDEPCPWLAPRDDRWRPRLYRPFVADHRPDHRDHVRPRYREQPPVPRARRLRSGGRLRPAAAGLGACP